MNKINFNIIVLSSVIRRVFIIPLCNILFKISSIICIPRASSCNNINNNNNNYYYLAAYFKRFIIHVLHINKWLSRVIIFYYFSLISTHLLFKWLSKGNSDLLFIVFNVAPFSCIQILAVFFLLMMMAYNSRSLVFFLFLLFGWTIAFRTVFLWELFL